VAELNLTSNITFLGYVENALDYVSAADIFVQSSMDEAFGVSILEALFLNKRIAITTPAGVIEFVSKFHEFLPSGNPEALGKKIISELDSLANTCLNCTQAQHDYLADNFDFSRTALGYRSVYRNLILN
jgi:glycosyltransferase involved in cell wall biosynthesis